MIKKKITFIIGFLYDKEYGGYVTKVFNLPGCMSQGKTIEEAKRNTLDAISLCWKARLKETRNFKKSIVVSTLLKDYQQACEDSSQFL